MATTNAAGIAIIKDYEGLVLTATPDPGGVLTIGYGHTLDIHAGDMITEAQAEQLLAQDLATFEAGVSALLNAPTTSAWAGLPRPASTPPALSARRCSRITTRRTSRLPRRPLPSGIKVMST